ncbi:uncharacterized protein LOC104888427 isoform X2 [Beta vulgaris subsp. vulgaris]|uniref:uncharacterized protein LOC104888427 isoform X2 n=1 Tax=Beta vulgaris subsp. vulgaris TaxID=3555 RepID=UPI00053FA0E0|nr:uncharacterized protein LOC104888427 isoform X2 [Beta vulgaris subsp. vulgaris]
MESFSGLATSSCFPVTRKKRSSLLRRPHPDPKPIISFRNVFKLPSSPIDYGGPEATDLHCSNGNLRMRTVSEGFRPPSAGHSKSDANKQGGYGHSGNENKLKKVKLKLGSITRTLHTKLTTEIPLESRPLGTRSIDSTVVSGTHLKQDFPRNSVLDSKENISRRNMDQNGDAMYELGHKNKRGAKQLAIDEGLDDEDDEEIRYLKKLRASMAASGHGDKQEQNGRKSKGIANLMGIGYFDTKDGRRRIYEDNDYEMELTSDDGLKSKRKRLKEDFVDPSGREMTMKTRKRALEHPESGGLVEFPNGLPSPPSKKQKLPEMDQQLRKAEAAQRRRLQAEKAAKEAQAEAIRKILGQDSDRKKEEKLKKQEELAQEKIVKAATLKPNTVRWIFGQHGTVVTFSEDMGLPRILNSLPCSLKLSRYPPPREKCVGPNCTNEYKYRDSKSKLPLCSLHCYKAVRGNVGLLPAC